MFCPKCGVSVPDDSAFCFKCGADLKAVFKATPPAQRVILEKPSGATVEASSKTYEAASDKAPIGQRKDEIQVVYETLNDNLKMYQKINKVELKAGNNSISSSVKFKSRLNNYTFTFNKKKAKNMLTSTPSVLFYLILIPILILDAIFIELFAVGEVYPVLTVLTLIGDIIYIPMILISYNERTEVYGYISRIRSFDSKITSKAPLVIGLITNAILMFVCVISFYVYAESNYYTYAPAPAATQAPLPTVEAVEPSDEPGITEEDEIENNGLVVDAVASNPVSEAEVETDNGPPYETGYLASFIGKPRQDFINAFGEPDWDAEWFMSYEGKFEVFYDSYESPEELIYSISSIPPDMITADGVTLDKTRDELIDVLGWPVHEYYDAGLGDTWTTGYNMVYNYDDYSFTVSRRKYSEAPYGVSISSAYDSTGYAQATPPYDLYNLAYYLGSSKQEFINVYGEPLEISNDDTNELMYYDGLDGIIVINDLMGNIERIAIINLDLILMGAEADVFTLDMTYGELLNWFGEPINSFPNGNEEVGGTGYVFDLGYFSLVVFTLGYDEIPIEIQIQSPLMYGEQEYTSNYIDENFEWVEQPTSSTANNIGGGFYGGEYVEPVTFGYTIEGTVRNISNDSFSFVSINYSLYDSQGNQVGTASDYISNLGAGNTWKFSASYYEENVSTFKFDGITAW
jgi:hypothetical protein